jgi:hypothetical protein
VGGAWRRITYGAASLSYSPPSFVFILWFILYSFAFIRIPFGLHSRFIQGRSRSFEPARALLIPKISVIYYFGRTLLRGSGWRRRD